MVIRWDQMDSDLRLRVISSSTASRAGLPS
jgi:hypothetical protein